MWKVIIADDEKLICRLIEALVDWEKLNMRIAGKAENGLEALQMVRELRPHLLITDIRMPGCDGPGAQPGYRDRHHQRLRPF